MNHKSAIVRSTLTPNAYNDSDYLKFTVGEPYEEINFGFMLMVKIFDDNTNEKPTDIDRLGTLKMKSLRWKWDPYEKISTEADLQLKFHSCTKDDV